MTLRTPAFNDAKIYGFEWLRYNTEIDNQEGVLNAGDLKTTAAAGGGMRVDVAAGAALVKGDSGVPGTGLSQGLFIVVNDAAIANAVTLAAAHATLPRIDQIVLRVRDSSDLGSGADDAIIDFVTGTATSGATLDNRNGAAALPADCLRLADVLIPAAAVAVIAGNVRDRRLWAKGAYSLNIRNSTNLSTTSVGQATLDAVNLAPRIECSGAPVTIRLSASGVNSTAGNNFYIMPFVDGASILQSRRLTVGIEWVWLTLDWDYVPAPGSHKFEIYWALVAGGSTLTMYANGADGANPGYATLTVEEMVRQNANNN